ncbi:hypothetical protein HN51_045887, partial [Arachis hypogaea]
MVVVARLPRRGGSGREKEFASVAAVEGQDHHGEGLSHRCRASTTVNLLLMLLLEVIVITRKGKNKILQIESAHLHVNVLPTIFRGKKNNIADTTAQSPSFVTAVSGRQRHHRRLVLSPSNPPSSPGFLPSSHPSPSSSSSQHQQAVALIVFIVARSSTVNTSSPPSTP